MPLAQHPTKQEDVMKTGVSVNEATHVKVRGEYKEIARKVGVGDNGRVEKSFGVVTTDGESVSMWQAQAYGKEE